MKRKPEPELMDLQDEVDAYAKADFRASNERFMDKAVAEFRQLGALTSSPTALDVGCGPGDITIALARSLPAWNVVGIDASEPMLDVARARATAEQISNVRFILGDAKALPNRGHPFDAIFSNSLLHHLPDPAGFWRSIATTLRPAGRFFLRDLRRPDSEASARDIVERHAGNASPLLKEEFFRSLLAAFTPTEVEAQLAAAGLASFSVTEVEDRYLDVTGTLA